AIRDGVGYPARRSGERASLLVVAPTLRADQAERGQVQGLEVAGEGDAMTEAGERLIGALREARAVARGEEPAARIWHRGWAYVPQPRSVDEAIVAAAVMLDDEVWQLPRPARHHHILWAIDQVL